MKEESALQIHPIQRNFLKLFDGEVKAMSLLPRFSMYFFCSTKYEILKNSYILQQFRLGVRIQQN